ncbi:MAG: UvrD-helicase domain-containing protein [candidate division KSB1 bacterium]|nr:UvrD-helicase domain-containing protein [candidate division KSB1 bacterium]MDZ7364371.1 UvrD-helicase domain-containing protein [candidate division KSB1 bacterium]MDZ7402743.1 UvrD-helicase domain-containing protein [candidate division KSB1 bacterium]
MKFVADLHLHSHFSRATSSQLDLEHLGKWAQLKGVTVVGTGDFTHPGWLDEVEKKLEPAEEGLFKLKEEFARTTAAEVPKACRSAVRFMLTTEISNIYKRLDKVRKVHNLIFSPSFSTARKIQARLETIGNIRSDGRPILGLDSRDLLEITLESDPLAFLIPAHIWTPWFSMLGSKGGFDSVEDCFADLTPHVFAVETGLSSDPPMNWRLRQLDRFVLVSNSDAHSPQKLAREANLFETELSYPAIFNALQDENDSGFLGTIEFFPEEGKYHYDGHRLCKMRLHPAETQANQGNCPVCGKPVTVGVMARVEELADRPEGEKSPRSRPYANIIPLPEIIGEAKNQKPATKAVEELFHKLLAGLGSELFILQEAALDDIERLAGSVVAEGIRRMRAGEVKIAAGYDGEYGTIQLFSPEERERLSTQVSMLDPGPDQKEQSDKTKNGKLIDQENTSVNFPGIGEEAGISYQTPKPLLQQAGALNPSQQQAVRHGRGHLLIVAGPGTGKTHTLTHRIAQVIENFARAEEILAITFTNKAAEEMRQRAVKIAGPLAAKITIGTFHAFCLGVLREYHEHAGLPPDFEIIGEDEQRDLAKELWPEKPAAERDHLLDEIALLKAADKISEPDQETRAAREVYDSALRKNGRLDFDDLLLETVRLLQENRAVRHDIHRRYQWIFVDEYQDINPAQHRLLKLLIHENAVLTAIGDPNQAIYGFRGADAGYFSKFEQDFAGAMKLYLEENYRSAPTLLSASTQVITAGSENFAMPLSAALLMPGRLTIHDAPTEKAEAEYVAHQIEKMVGGTSMFSQDSGRVEKTRLGEHTFGDFAVLYRLNALRPALEEALSRAGMPYQISGDAPLVSRRGVRELTTAIGWLCNIALQNAARQIHPKNLAALLQFALPGIGEQTARRAEGFFTKIHQLEAGAFDRFLREERSLTEKQKLALAAFSCELEEAGRRFASGGLVEAMQFLLNLPTWKSLMKGDEKLAGHFQRVLNLARLCEFSNRAASVRAFFDALALEGAADHFDPRAEKIALMTLHAAKGLEFSVVFIIGCEETLLPMQLPGLQSAVEEERRLFYVGMTRAKEQLYLLRAKRRLLFGRWQENPASRFLADIEEQLKAYEKWQAPARKEPKKHGDENQLGLF